jgi:hypothetical protein
LGIKSDPIICSSRRAVQAHELQVLICALAFLLYTLGTLTFDQTSRVQKLKKTLIYVKPQLTSDSGNCRVSVMVGIRNDPGKPIDSITVQFQLPPLIVSVDLTANYGTVDILADKVSVLPTISSTVTPLIPDLVIGQGKGSIVGSFRKFSKLSTLHVPSPCYASLKLAFLCRPVCGQLGRYQKTKHRHSLEIYDWRKGSHNCMHCRHFT